MAVSSNVAFKIAAKPLHMVTFDSICEVAVALYNNTIADRLRRTI